MRHFRFSVFPPVLVAAAVLVLPQRTLGGVHSTGADFAENVSGFRLLNLEQERVCRLPTALPARLKPPLVPAAPPPSPFDDAVFDLALVVQRHGSRRSTLKDARSPPHYQNTKPGQLTPQGAYELHVAGIEVRNYLINALSSWRDQKARSNTSEQSPEAVYRRTLGLDLAEDCRTAGLSPSVCTLSNLVYALGQQFPEGTVYARSSALPRTQWSGLNFLQGFYGLPFECVGTIEELDDTAGGRTEDVCLRRSACDFSAEALDSTDTLQEHCTFRRLPCVRAPPVAEDGLMSAATVSKAYADATAYYASKGVKRIYEPQDPQTREALHIAEKVYGEKALGKNSAWMAGDMAFAEIAAGAETPLHSVALWVQKQKRRCSHPAAKCKPEQVPSYEAVVRQLLNAFKENTNMQYADGQFSRYAVSPYIALQNALFRVRAFGRDEDRRHLQEMCYVIGGFDDYKQEGAVEKLKMVLLSFHDFLLLALMELLEIRSNELLPFAARIIIELSHLNSNTQSGDMKGRQIYELQDSNRDYARALGNGEVGSALPGQGSWPKTSHHVRVLVGVPGGVMEPTVLPWCGGALACPLDRWLNYTDEKLSGHWFYNVAADFSQKYLEAQVQSQGSPP